MKKPCGGVAIAILVTIAMLTDCSSVEVKANESPRKEEAEIIETKKLPDLLAYEDFCKLYTCKEEAKYYNPMIIEVDQEDAVRLMKIAQAEAGETDSLAIAYVMKVIINRRDDDYFPNTIEEIIQQPKQFSPYKNGLYTKTVPNDKAHYALYLLESGQIDIKAEYFESTLVKDSWQSRHRELEFEYGGHRFYK